MSTPPFAERPDVRVVRERAVEVVPDDLEDGLAHLLHDAREHDRLVLLEARHVEAVGVHPDDERAGVLERRGRRALADLAGDGEDDVGALVDEALGEDLALVLVLVVAE